MNENLERENRPTSSLSYRTVQSIGWNFAGNVAQILVGFTRSILLARLLPIESFGVYAWASSVVVLASVFPDFGFGAAFVHRSPETEDEDQMAAAHFTLQLLVASVWMAALLALAMLASERSERMALTILTLTTTVLFLARTPRLLLVRQVRHRRLALVDLASFVLSTIVTLFLAWRGVTLWALLASNVVTAVTTVVGFYAWKPLWRPRLIWSPEINRYFLRYGSRNLVASILMHTLDRVDDLWVGSYLGSYAMGLYSRAYTFATYPRKILALPVDSVSLGTYAELRDAPARLSHAFIRFNALLVRTGFLLAGVLFLVAPEFIRVFLGERWLPMLATFQLMLLYTLFDPLKLTIANLFVAMGRPEIVVRTRTGQLVILVAGLLILGPRWGIAGVALAVDAMLFVGIGYLLIQARQHVRFSFARLLAAPLIGLFISLGITIWAVRAPWLPDSDFIVGSAKLILFSGVYSLTLLLLERHWLGELLRELRTMLPRYRSWSRNELDG
jgi:O-antigen/teichoic acid export membrane protein